MARTLRPYLEYQADRAEAVLAAHRAPARVTGGTIGPRVIRFFLAPAPHIRYATIRRLSDDLALALRVPQLRVSRGTEGVVLEFPNPAPTKLTLRSLLKAVSPLSPGMALLGLTQDGTPLLARLPAPEVTHILISGTTGSGKSVLLRSVIASLLVSSSPRELRLLCFDPKGRTFPPLESAPHLVRPPITEAGEAAEAFRSLLRLMEARDKRRESHPLVVVGIDELADLILQGGKEITEAVTRLAQRGREAGIHLVAATQRPSSDLLGGLMRANFPLRLVGKVVSADDARVAAGRGGTEAHLLNGRGDFLAVSGGDVPTRFQAAYSDEDEIRELVQSRK